MKRHREKTRAGVTIVELMVVIGLIAFLISLSVVIFGGVISAAKRSASVTTIKKLDELLKSRMDAFNRWADNLPEKNIITLGDLHGLGDSGNRSKILGRKELFRQYFPQNLGEIDLQFLERLGYNRLNNDPATENAEALYIFLTQMESFGAEPIGADTFGPDETADTDEDGLLELVDGWERPLRFYRWPTRLMRGGAWDPGSPPDPDTDTSYTLSDRAADQLGTLPVDTTAYLAIQDLDDQLGLIESVVVAEEFTAAEFEAAYHTVDTYHIPLIVSAGLDGLLGFYEPIDSDNFGYLGALLPSPLPGEPDLRGLEDNITNLNQRAGGR